jgi:hypothetical protein
MIVKPIQQLNNYCMEKLYIQRTKGSGLDWTESLSVDEADGALSGNPISREGVRSISAVLRVKTFYKFHSINHC